jgi:predicted O-linked N-acetylglucosamine transferase (SPINDLY family)
MLQADAKTIRFRERVLKKGGVWKDIYGTDEKKVADMVREDQVDILVELTGHTANNKLGMMACRPAPVQVFLTNHVSSYDKRRYTVINVVNVYNLFSSNL